MNRGALTIRTRKADERGHADYGWLDTHHTFSFNTFHDPEYEKFRVLRVMNEDRIAAGQGFGSHPHRDMEIISYVLEGGLEHCDSMGTGSVIRPGELQRMSAGTGVYHSEYNASKTDAAHFYQIWLHPDKKNAEPSYEQKSFPASDREGRMQLVVSPDGAEGSLTIHQNARMYLGNLGPGAQIVHPLDANRHAWLQVVRGRASLNGEQLETSDGAAISDESELRIDSQSESAHVMLFDLP